MSCRSWSHIMNRMFLTPAAPPVRSSIPGKVWVSLALLGKLEKTAVPLCGTVGATREDRVRTLQRGLAVYAFVLRCPGAGFAEIRAGTGLPKAVVHRILAELHRSSFIWRTLSDGRYHPCRHPLGAGGGSADRRLAEASVTPLLDLNAALVWPSDVFVFSGTGMRLQESSRRQSPFLMNPETIGREVDALPTAVGRAYLGALPPRALDQALAELRQSGEWDRQAALCAEDPLAAIAAAGRQGYAFRDPAFLGQDGRDDGIQGLAVPIRGRDRPLGAVNLVWIRSALDRDAALAAWLAPLQRCAARIAAAHDGE